MSFCVLPVVLYCWIQHKNKTPSRTVVKYLTNFHVSQAKLQMLAPIEQSRRPSQNMRGLGEANCLGRLPFWQEKQSQQSMDWKWQLDQEMEGRREKTEEEYETGL